jgi:putative membrane protein insertion efficiency factor
MSPTYSLTNPKRPWARVAALPRLGLVALVRGYRFFLSPWLGSACRFEPTCSLYAIEALERHGAVVGSALTTGRLLRCHPWCAGGCDPVPQAPPRPFSSLLGGGGVRPSLPPTLPATPTPEPNQNSPGRVAAPLSGPPLP